jgi:hypothetical protein
MSVLARIALTAAMATWLAVIVCVVTLLVRGT